jgi:hypothetical protein
MMDFIRPEFNFGGIQVIESENCLQPYQLTDFTKELMGYKWVEKFNATTGAWLPKQPACYMVGDDKMIVHPSVSKAIRDAVEARNKCRFRTQYGLNMMNSHNAVMINCV